MFEKKCGQCGNKIKKEYVFCPSCGSNLKDTEDYGLLGKEDDIISDINLGMPFGLDKMLNSLIKRIDSQFVEQIKQEEPKMKRVTSGISMNIVIGNDGMPKIHVNKFGDEADKVDVVKEKKSHQLSEEQIKKLTALPRVQPKTQVRRFGNKIIYELYTIGVKSEKDIIITKLENSTEIKAIGIDKVYAKTLPVKFPLINYAIEGDFTILEFQGK
jgi:hypothetical protein